MKAILYPQAGNKLAVVIPSDAAFSDEEIARRSVPEGVTFSIVEKLDLADDFFDAYEYQVGAPVFIPEKAKEIQRDKWRLARTPLLAQLDLKFMRAIEEGDLERQSEIAAEKKSLRDVTKTEIEGQTPEEIRAEWPSILK